MVSKIWCNASLNSAIILGLKINSFILLLLLLLLVQEVNVIIMNLKS